MLPALLAPTTLLGAFLLFFVQPMAAKWLLPELGGSPATWGACMVFFQAVLLGGYAYAHVTTQYCAPRVQAVLHLVLVAACVLLSVHATTLTAPVAALAPHAWPPLAIALRLGQLLGARCLLLACTAPLLQRWFALLLRREPYALYALSNVGSLGALLAYPFLVEPELTLAAQYALFSAAFFLLALLTACAALLVLRFVPTSAQPPLQLASRTSSLFSLRSAAWVVLAALPSALVLAVTNQLTTDVAATPLFWVTPLAVYLLTYIIAFRGAGISATTRTVLLTIYLLASVLLGWNSFAQGSASFAHQLLATLGVLFAGALLAHDQLVRLRPEAHQLTGFYLCIAWGGVLGASLVSWVAPLLLDDCYELELCVLALYGVFAFGQASMSRAQRNVLLLGLGVALPILLGALITRAGGETRQGTIVERRRSFLGPLRVTDLPEGRVLTHGRIRHGMQLVGNTRALRDRPTMYFGPGSALARVLERHHADRPRRIAIIGLGVGTIAAYGKAGDQLRFYELDPEVAALARRDFTFLRDTPAATQLILGDGRLSLTHELPQQLDVLALDAFSSDAVPVHLLTREAFAIYARHLAPDGMILSNVSNRHLEVERVVQASARANGFACRVVETLANAKRFTSQVRWAVIAKDPKQLDALLDGMPLFPKRGPELLWTDQRASVLPILR